VPRCPDFDDVDRGFTSGARVTGGGSVLNFGSGAPWAFWGFLLEKSGMGRGPFRFIQPSSLGKVSSGAEGARDVLETSEIRSYVGAARDGHPLHRAPAPADSHAHSSDPIMRLAISTVVLLPSLLFAQKSPVADAFRMQEKNAAKNLVAAVEEVPADKLNYRPTSGQMSFAQIIEHLSMGNDALCGIVGGMKAPARSKIDTTSSREAQIARLKETFEFCDRAVAKLDDSNLGETGSMFGTSMTRAGWILTTTGDWEDHYSQLSNYLRLNGLVPPTAKPKK